MEFRTLNADEIDVKVGTVGDGYYTVLLYKNARVDMAILDETVKPENWQRDHKEVKGNLYCGIGINCGFSEFEDVLDNNGNVMGKKITKTIDRWVWKWDCGVESDFGDKQKGEASDSFKRAGFNWGIGRELYTAPKIYINCETTTDDGKHYKIKNVADIRQSNSLKVKEIEYNEKREITKLVIVDTKGVQVYPKSVAITKENAVISGNEIHCVECDESVSKKVAEYSVSKYGKVLCFNCQKDQKPKEVEV